MNPLSAQAFGRLRGRSGGIFVWGLAFIGALGLNLLLFGLMPGLIQQIPKAPDQLDNPARLNVIRVRKRRRHRPAGGISQRSRPPEPEKPRPRARETKRLQKKLSVKPRLKFDINPRLPAAPMDLAMPPPGAFLHGCPGPQRPL